ncbi:MAG: hypothetical protein JRJ23_09745, partial [Deltaproteobacteria bacterium]|nr:hypothetical protein [Deltaproteobacteria bacterium]
DNYILYLKIRQTYNITASQSAYGQAYQASQKHTSFVKSYIGKYSRDRYIKVGKYYWEKIKNGTLLYRGADKLCAYYKLVGPEGKYNKWYSESQKQKANYSKKIIENEYFNRAVYCGSFKEAEETIDSLKDSFMNDKWLPFAK